MKREFSDHNPLYAELDESVDVELRLGLRDRLQTGADGGVRRRIGSAASCASAASIVIRSYWDLGSGIFCRNRLRNWPGKTKPKERAFATISQERA